jgi:hypothetical protein
MLEISKVWQLLFVYLQSSQRKGPSTNNPQEIQELHSCWTQIKQLTKCHFQLEAFDRLFRWVGKFKKWHPPSATKMHMVCDAEMVFKFLFVDVNGWTVWTLKSDGCGAKGAKVRDNYTSSRIVNVGILGDAMVVQRRNDQKVANCARAKAQRKWNKLVIVVE